MPGSISLCSCLHNQRRRLGAACRKVDITCFVLATMLTLLKGINQLVYFLVELGMFAALGYVGFHSTTHPYGKYAAAIGLPLVAIVLWGIFAAPKSAYRLEPLYRSVFALTLFGITALLLYKTGNTRLALPFAGVALASELIAFLLKQ